MILVCVACGSNGPLERHHVGRRKYSDVTTMLCKSCHFYCTVSDVYERIWRPGQPPLVRLWAGVMDVWNRFAECNSMANPSIAMILNDAEYQGLFRYRPCSAVASYVEQVSTDTLPEQCQELTRLINTVIHLATDQIGEQKS